MSDTDDKKIEQLLREPIERVEPRPGFEARLYEALAAKQAELGRTGSPRPPTSPPPTLAAASAVPEPSSERWPILVIVLAACGAVAASLAFSVIVGRVHSAPAASPTPSVTALVPTAAPSSATVVRVEPSPPSKPPRTPEVPRVTAARILEAPAHEPLRATLEDGSVLFLDEGARAVVLGERSIRLEYGRAFLEVAKKLSGTTEVPFRVEGPAGEAIAHGTKLALDASAEGLAVAVAQGRVALRGAAGGEVELAPGEVGHVAPHGLPQAGASPRLSHVVSWLRELYGTGTAPLVTVENKRPGFGDLVALDPQGQEARLSVRRLHVDVHVEDGVARTTIDTTYFNHMNWRLEGTFYFPVPPGASITRLAMYVDGKLMEGGVAEREQARAAYESIVYKRRDPALLEWMEGNVFKMRIFPLEARQEKRVIVCFTQELESLYGTLRYALPLDAGKELCRDFSVSMRWKNAAASSAASPTYALSQAREGDDLVLGFEQADAAPKKDLVVYVSDRAGELSSPPPPTSAADEDGHRFVLARFRPDLGSRSARTAHMSPRSFVVLYDASGSRTPLELKAQREVLARLLAELDDGDRVKLLALNTRTRAWKPDWREARTSAGDAIAFVDSVRAIGATDLAAGLAEAARSLEGVKEGAYVVYLGDGIATLGERDPSKLARLIPSGTAFVGVGVGKRVDSPMLEALAAATGGTCALVGPDEPIAWRVFDLVAALATPRVVGLDVSALDPEGHVLEGSVHLSRTVAADGEEVRVVGRFDKVMPAKLVLKGQLNSRPFVQELSLAGIHDGATYLPRLWARGRVERLLREGAEANKAEITALGKANFIATPFTSLLVLENDAMYTELKIERGKPDPFAFYSTPAKIEVKTEPLAGPASVASSGEPRWKNDRDFLSSIAARNQAVAYDSYSGYYDDRIYALDSLGSLSELIDLPMDKPDFRAVRLGLYPATYDGQLTFNVITASGLFHESTYAGFIDRTVNGKRASWSGMGGIPLGEAGLPIWGTPVSLDPNIPQNDALRRGGGGQGNDIGFGQRIRSVNKVSRLGPVYGGIPFFGSSMLGGRLQNILDSGDRYFETSSSGEIFYNGLSGADVNGNVSQLIARELSLRDPSSACFASPTIGGRHTTTSTRSTSNPSTTASTSSIAWLAATAGWGATSSSTGTSRPTSRSSCPGCKRAAATCSRSRSSSSLAIERLPWETTTRERSSSSRKRGRRSGSARSSSKDRTASRESRRGTGASRSGGASRRGSRRRSSSTGTRSFSSTKSSGSRRAVRSRASTQPSSKLSCPSCRRAPHTRSTAGTRRRAGARSR